MATPAQNLPNTCAPYQYSELHDNTRDIRVLTLLPGKFGDIIKVNIGHVSPQDREMEGRLGLSELRQTLPSTWEAHETFDGRYIFAQKRGDTFFTTWSHPDPAIPPAKYEPILSGLSWPETFEALSYTWGSKEAMKTVIVEDVVPHSKVLMSKSTKIMIRQNLAIALQHLRQHDKPRKLWIDALCINQDDQAERNEQVRRIGSIFANASRVIIWLGPKANRTHHALSTLEFIAKQFVVCDLSYWLPAPEAQEKSWYDPWAILPYGDETWDPIIELVERDWFFRRWVIQESALGNRLSVVQCGQDIIKWSDFCTACAYLTMKPNLPQKIRAITERVMRMAFDYKSRSLCSHLKRFYEKQCEDDKDRIYALLGIASESFKRILRPQYSLTAPEVYKNAFLAEMSWSKRLEFLILCSLRHKTDPGPTWVPDLTSEKPFETDLRFQFCSGFAGSAASYLEPNTLVVKGVKCGQVESVSPPCSSSIAQIWSFLSDWLPPKITINIAAGDEATIDILVRTIACNLVSDRFVDPTFPTIQQWKSLILPQELLIDHSGNENSNTQFIDRVSPIITERASSSHVGRAFFISEDGLIGLCPLDTVPGDIFGVLLGFDTPMMLRPIAGIAYQVVGQCSVVSLQDANSLLGPLPAPRKVEFKTQEGQIRPSYVQTSTGVRTFEDPRLRPLQDWEPHDTIPNGVTSESAAVFRNIHSGETVHSDPRITPEEIEIRGVKLTGFALV